MRRKTRFELEAELSRAVKTGADLATEVAALRARVKAVELEAVNRIAAQEAAVILKQFINTMLACRLEPETVLTGAAVQDGALAQIHFTVGYLKTVAGVVRRSQGV